MYHASSSADENISMNMGLVGPDGCGSNGMFNDASSTEADGRFDLCIVSYKIQCIALKNKKQFIERYFAIIVTSLYIKFIRLPSSTYYGISKRYSGIMPEQQVE